MMVNSRPMRNANLFKLWEADWLLNSSTINADVKGDLWEAGKTHNFDFTVQISVINLPCGAIELL